MHTRRFISGDRFLLCMACFVTVAASFGCGGTSETKTVRTSPPPTITVTPSSASLTHSMVTPSSVQFTATVQNAPDPTVVWSVNELPNGNNTVGTISDTGLYTAPVTGEPGTVVVAAMLKSSPANKSSAMVQLNCAYRVTLSTPAGASVPENSRLPIEALSENSCGNDLSLLWSVDGALPPTAATGLVTAGDSEWHVWFYPPAAVPPGPVTVTAAQRLSGVSASVAVTVLPEVDALLISPSDVAVAIGAHQVFTATRDGQEIPVTWLVNGSEMPDARVGWMSAGEYSAPFDPPNPALAIVSAVDTSSTPHLMGRAVVTVSAPAANANARLHGSYATLLTSPYSFLLGTLAFDGQGHVIGTITTATAPKYETLVTSPVAGEYELRWDGHAILQLHMEQAASDIPTQMTWDALFTSEAAAEVATRLPENVYGAAPFYGRIERQELAGFSAAAFPATYVTVFTEIFGDWNYSCTYSCDPYPIKSAVFTGALRADAAGALTGQVDDSSHEPSVYSLLGSYSVSDTGWGSANLKFEPNPTAVPVQIIAINNERFLLAGTDGTSRLFSGEADRQDTGVSAATLHGVYVYGTMSSLMRFEADGAGHASGRVKAIEFVAFAQSPTVIDLQFTATYTVDQFGRVLFSFTDPDWKGTSGAFYLVSPERFRGGDASRFTGGYVQSAPPEAAEILGRYVATNWAGWVSLEPDLRAVGLMIEVQSPMNWYLRLPDHYPENQGELYWSESTPETNRSEFYVASPDLLVLRGAVLQRIRW